MRTSRLLLTAVVTVAATACVSEQPSTAPTPVPVETIDVDTGPEASAGLPMIGETVAAEGDTSFTLAAFHYGDATPDERVGALEAELAEADITAHVALADLVITNDSPDDLPVEIAAFHLVATDGAVREFSVEHSTITGADSNDDTAETSPWNVPAGASATVTLVALVEDGFMPLRLDLAGGEGVIRYDLAG